MVKVLKEAHMSIIETPKPEVNVIDLRGNPIVPLCCGCLLLGMALFGVLVGLTPPGRSEMLLSYFITAASFAFGLGVTIHSTVALARKKE
jgi:hypothetical protein